LVALVVATSVFDPAEDLHQDRLAWGGVLTRHTVQNMNAITADVMATIKATHPDDDRQQTVDYLLCIAHNIRSRLLVPTYGSLMVDLDRQLLDRLNRTIVAIVTKPTQPMSLELLFG